MHLLLFEEEKRMFEQFIHGYENLLRILAEITVCTLEVIGIAIIVFGSAKVLFWYIKKTVKRGGETKNVVIELGRSLGFALEFIMGAEIIKTIVGNELKEFLILGIIIILRALLSILIHWEITTEEKEERAHIILMEQARKSKEEKSEEKKDK